MSTVIKNITTQTVSPSVMLGIKAEKKLSSAISYSNYDTTNTKKWYRQSTEKLCSFDWDANMNELEFE